MAGFKGQNVRLVVLWARPHDGAAANQSTEGGPEIQSVQRAWSGQGPGWWEFQEKQLRGPFDLAYERMGPVCYPAAPLLRAGSYRDHTLYFLAIPTTSNLLGLAYRCVVAAGKMGA